MSSATAASPSTPPLVALLSRLTLAVARRRAYGDVHPMVAEADEALAEALARHVETGSALTLAVAQRELLVDGQPAPAGAVAQELASRLHMLNIGAVKIHQGVTKQAVSGFVSLLARRPSEVRPDDTFPDLAGIAIGRIDLDVLGLADEEAVRAETSQLWRTLAERVLAAVDADAVSSADAEGSSPATLGAALSQAAASEEAAQQAFEALNGMAEQVTMSPRRVREEIGERLQALLSATEQEALVSALRAGARGPRARLVANVVDVLPAAAVVRWLNSAALASGRDLSPHLLRLLSKLSVHFRGRRPEAATEELRETARELVEGWDLKEPNPEEHATLLETLAAWTAREDKRGGSAAREALFDPRTQEAVRLVQMAIEIDAVSDDTALAVQRLADEGHAATVLAWIERAASSGLGERLRNLTLTPAAILQVLLATPFDATEARKLLDATPPEASGALLEALERCESRAGRRLIYDRLRTMPSSIAGTVVDRLSQPMPWYFARNLVSLLRDLLLNDAAVAERLVPGPLLLFQRHEHVAVRREAVRLLVMLPTTRTAAVRRALDDESSEVQQTAIDAAFAARTHAWPADVAQRLLAFAGNEALDAGVREKALRAVSGCTLPDVRDWLVAHVSRRSALRGALKLAPATPTVRAAVQLLETRYASDPQAGAVLALARKAGLAGGAGA